MTTNSYRSTRSSRSHRDHEYKSKLSIDSAKVILDCIDKTHKTVIRRPHGVDPSRKGTGSFLYDATCKLTPGK